MKCHTGSYRARLKAVSIGLTEITSTEKGIATRTNTLNHQTRSRAMTDRNYKVSGKKMLPNKYNRNRNQAKKLGRALRRMRLKTSTRFAEALRQLGEEIDALHPTDK